MVDVGADVVLAATGVRCRVTVLPDILTDNSAEHPIIIKMTTALGKARNVIAKQFIESTNPDIDSIR